MTNAGSLARRYAPFLILAAVQVLLVAVVPSTGGPGAGRNTSALGPGAGAGAGNTFVDPETGQIIDAVTGEVLGTSPEFAAGGVTGGTGGTGRTGGTGGGGGLTGDKSKCAPDGKRQQDITLASPPCVAKFAGNNGGATYKQGVTAEEVVVLRYRPKSNQAVDALLATQGLASSADEERIAQDAFAKFFEKRYEFYGRKVRWEWVQGTCEMSPPDVPCFRTEVNRLNDKFKPFAVYYTAATNQSEFFEEWTKLGVVNVGGWHFNNDWVTSQRPYHYDLFMDGSRAVRHLADYWCKKMQGKNANLSGDITAHTKRRKVGILTQDFEVTRKNAQEFYAHVTGGMCGSKVDAAEPVYTPSDISKSQLVARTNMERLKNDGVTSVVIMTDPLNPHFSSRAATELGWYPEWLLSGTGLIDYDVLGRLYDQSQWRNAFGPGHLGEPIPFGDSDAARAARDVGVNSVYSGANLLYSYMAQIASLIQMTGPNLNPENMERNNLALPAQGGWERTKNPASVLLKYGPGDYTLIEDSRHTYWDPNAVSKIDNKPGAYRAVSNGQRWELGKWPTGEPRQ